jgi:tetratricopeptide (TPR) repeat protein
MHDPIFEDRKDELEALRSIVQSTGESGTIVLLKGPSGRGKSRLTQQLAADHELSLAVRARLPKFGELPPDGSLITCIASALDELASNESEVLSLDQFARRHDSPHLQRRWRRRVRTEVVEKTTLKYAVTATQALHAVSHTGEFGGTALMASEDSENVLIRSDYVRSVTQNIPLVVIVENAQRADQSSLDFLGTLLPVSRAFTLILEMTTGDGLPAETVLRSLTNSTSQVVEIDLPPLEYEHWRRLVGPQAAGIDSYLRRKHRTDDGNLREVVDLRTVLNLGQKPGEWIERLENTRASSTSLRIADVSDSAFALLALLRAHGEAARTELVTRASEMFNRNAAMPIDLTHELEILNGDFVALDNGIIRLSQDRVGDAIETDRRYPKFSSLAYSLWSDLYVTILDQSDFMIISEADVLRRAFRLLAISDPTRLIRLAPRIGRVVPRAFTPRNALTYLDELQQHINSSFWQQREGQQLAWQLADSYYQLGFFPQALSVLDAFLDRCDRHIAFHAALLDRLDRHDEVLEEVSSVIASGEAAPGTSLWLVLRLIEMMSARSMNDFARAEQIFRLMLNEPKISQLPEYPFFLRNAEIVLSPKESIPHVERSAMLLMKQGDGQGASASYNTLGMLLMLIGEFEKANKAYNLAETSKESFSFDEHIILNNRGALTLLMQGDPGKARTFFSRALPTATANFDRLAVYMNMVVANELSGSSGLADDYAERLRILAESERQPDQVILLSAWFNLHWLHRRHDRMRESKEMLDRARAAFTFESDGWRARLWEATTSHDPDNVRFNFDFDLGILSHWHFPIGEHLEH